MCEHRYSAQLFSTHWLYALKFGWNLQTTCLAVPAIKLEKNFREGGNNSCDWKRWVSLSQTVFGFESPLTTSHTRNKPSWIHCSQPFDSEDTEHHCDMNAVKWHLPARTNIRSFVSYALSGVYLVFIWLNIICTLNFFKNQWRQHLAMIQLLILIPSPAACMVI